MDNCQAFVPRHADVTGEQIIDSGGLLRHIDLEYFYIADHLKAAALMR